MAIAEFETYYSTPDDDQHYDEAASIQRMRNGEGEGFTDIYNRYSDELRGYLIKTAGNQIPRDTLEDILQDSFLKAFEHIDKYEDRGSSLGAWIFTITRNNLMTYFRKQSRREHIEGVELWADTTLNPERPHEDYVYSMGSQAIVNFLIDNAITPPERLDAILAVKVSELSQREYSDMQETPTPVGTVGSRVNRGRADITSQFKNRKELLAAVFPDK